LVTGIVVVDAAPDDEEPESPHAAPRPANANPPDTTRPLPRNDRRDNPT
jgi:hypothetical protein